ncbi:MAG: hypothetical protein Alpg2KO_32360 [Alphaproteobacteria bacterium]
MPVDPTPPENIPDEDVAAALVAALEQEPDSAQLWIEYALWLAEIEDNHEKAEAALRRAVATGREPWLSRMHLAMWLREREGSLEEARDLLEQAISHEPEDSFSHAALGDILAEMGQLERAEDPYRKSLDLDPDNALAWCGLAQVFSAWHGDLDSAEQALDAAIEIDQDCAPAWIQMAELLSALPERAADAKAAQHRANLLMQAEGLVP